MTPKLQVPVKEMTMNKLDFNEVVFGGNIKRNLKLEANMNSTVVREKLKQTISGLATKKSTVLKEVEAPIMLHKHQPKKPPQQPLHTVFTKIPPSHFPAPVVDSVPST